MRQIDLVRETSKGFDRALERALEMAVPAASALESVAPGQPTGDDLQETVEVLRGARPAEALESLPSKQARFALEAIILEELRPAWFIKNDAIEISGNYDRIDLVEANQDKLSDAARRVGRVDLFYHPTHDYVGTGWLIDENIAVTNRHVAEAFAQADGMGGWDFARGTSDSPIEARIDFLREHEQAQQDPRRAAVLEILYVAGPREPDFAFLRVTPPAGMQPLDFEGRSAEADEPIAAIGYPAWDGERNDPKLMAKLFGGIYNVKRFSPGLARSSREKDVFEADYTSLGGNSGSAVISLETGKALGLHFAGVFRDTNYAVAGPIVQAALRQIRTQESVPLEAPARDPVTKAEQLADRKGYVPEFLGDGHVVPLPGFGTWAGDLAPLTSGGGHELKYAHFSVVQCASRRLPLVTAVNIDGEKAFNLKREGDWRLDGRLSPDHQIGNDLYLRNPIDRGHLVRRMDPGWGDTREEAQQAEDDTFHYTNSAPQHEDLNQKIWLSLEDYILQSAATRGFRACILTGPVFRKDDKRLKRQPGAEDIRIPREYWKVAAMINDDSGRLSVTGYVLSQGEMIKSLTEAAFVYGQYKTYQVKLSLIEKATGLDFGDLRKADPLASSQESLFGAAAIPIAGPESLTL